MQCYLFEAPKYIFFAPDIPELLYYSHLPTMLITLLVGLFVFAVKPSGLQNRLLFAISISFSAWVLISLIAWTNINGDLIAATWPFFGILAGLISILSIYFVYTFVNETDVNNKVKAVFILLLLPLFMFAHTDLSVSGFNLANCDAFDFEGIIYKSYYTFLGLLSFIWILFILVNKYRQASAIARKKILYLGVGIEFFLFNFIFIVFIVTYLTSLGYYEDSRLEMYALFSMTFFMVMLATLIVQYKTFDAKIHATKVLTLALVILIASQYTYANSTTTSVLLTTLTLVLTIIAGLYLNRTVNKEIKQREQLEKLTEQLARANKRLRELDKTKSEFVSIASHQLRSPLTSMRGYASMLLEGSYGQLPAKAKEVVSRIADSTKIMAASIEDYLNVSRIEAGNMKYELSDFNLKDRTERITDDKRQEAIHKGLLLLFKSNLNSTGIVHADVGKTEQILHNLINNAMKYTVKGSITVYVHDDLKAKKIYVDIKDTGIGMSSDTIANLFGKFTRAENANSVNISGTGLGLYVARSLAQAMKGDITATSEGDGKGSCFRLTLPLQM